MSEFLLKQSRGKLLFIAATMIVIIALIDWRVEPNASFDFLYLFPILIVASSLERWQVALLAGMCAFLAESLGPFPWEPSAGIGRDLFMLAAFLGTGLYALETAKNRRLMSDRVRAAEAEAVLRGDAAQELNALIESVPAAILTVDSKGNILLANQAAHSLLGFWPRTLPGESIKDFLPPLARIHPTEEASLSFRTAMRGNGRRRDGQVFLADIWFSTFETSVGPKLVAMFVDSSEEFRDNVESSLRHLLVASRLAGGALLHEIRNGCGAISVVHKHLSRNYELARNEQFCALGHLVQGLEKIASLELQQIAGVEELANVNLRSVFDELRIVAELSLRESGVLLCWDLPKVLPRVLADRDKLLQVLVNLTKNSQRAMQEQVRKILTITAALEDGRVVVRVRDTGNGIPHPERLFKPFQPGAEDTGLGLYLSRAFVRTFKGDLWYEPEPIGCCFALGLIPVAEEKDEGGAVKTNG
ncbi:MAG TPA: ATP-binding protein [Candidatus Angelobacter sp.]|nr:ATP-binding protein [Candidatus Angelobacter sp.]